MINFINFSEFLKFKFVDFFISIPENIKIRNLSIKNEAAYIIK